MEMAAKGNTASRSKEKPFPERKTKKFGTQSAFDTSSFAITTCRRRIFIRNSVDKITAVD